MSQFSFSLCVFINNVVQPRETKEYFMLSCCQLHCGSEKLDVCCFIIIKHTAAHELQSLALCDVCVVCAAGGKLTMRMP